MKSAAGRDKGGYMAVVGSEGDRAYLCNGKTRPLQRPKPKNIRHIEKTGYVLNDDMMKTNRQLRRALNECQRAQGR